MSKFTKKPVTVEAFQMTAERRYDNADWPQWLHEAWNRPTGATGALQPTLSSGELEIVTLEGVHRVTWGDWIIKGVHGELYPCKPEIFEKTYRPAAQALTFGEAIEALKAGRRVARTGWNGKGMWLVLVPGQKDVALRAGTPYEKALGDVPPIEILPHIDMWTVNAHGRRAMLPGWLASQTDMLAEDWVVLP